MPDSVVNLEGELWKPIAGYEGLYEISTLGRARSCTRRVPHPNRWGAKGSRVVRGELKSPGIGNYALLVLYRGGKGRTFLLHRLVLEAFIGPCPKGAVCCHNNGNKFDNRLENLRWDTQASNESDKVIHGTRAIGIAVYNAKFTDSNVRSIRRLRKAGWTLAKLSTRFGASQSTLCAMCLRKTYRHVI